MSYFYERFEMLCIKNGISPSAAAKAVGLSNAAASGWADGSAPRKITIRKLAEFFGVPVSYFEDGQKEKTATTDGDSLTELQKEIMSVFSQLPEQDQRLLIEQSKAILRLRGQ